MTAYQGDQVNDDGINRLFRAKLRPQQIVKPWKAHFVVSTEATERLPQCMAEKDLVKTLCVISVDIRRVQKKVRNRHWWNFGERYEIAQLVVKLIPGFADLQFRLISGGNLLNSEEDKVEVAWSAGARPASIWDADDLGQPY